MTVYSQTTVQKSDPRHLTMEQYLSYCYDMEQARNCGTEGYQSLKHHSKALYNKTFQAKRYKENILGFEKNRHKDF